MRTATVDASPAFSNTFPSLEPSGSAVEPALKGRRGVFRVQEDAKPLVSSGVKRIYRGKYEAFDGVIHDAIAVVFAKDQARRFGMETATLARNGLLDVGPRVYELLSGRITQDDAPNSPIIIEEDAGVSLEDVIFCGAGIPEAGSNGASLAAGKGTRNLSATTADVLLNLDAFCQSGMKLAGLHPLHPLGTLERAKENAKIMFDVLSQAANMHEQNIYHRDLRAANVCVKRYGPAPEDIRATIIDFEMSSGLGDGEPEARAKTYYDALFRDLPQSLGLGCDELQEEQPAHVSREDILGGHVRQATLAAEAGEGERLAPTPLEVDLGYLAALRYELSTGRSITTATGPELSVGEWPFFSYDQSGHIIAHKICPQDDIIPLGEELGLVRITEGLFPEPSVRSYLSGTFKHYGFLDAHDLQMYRQSQGIYGSIGLIARELFARYKDHVKRDEQIPDYEYFEDQPQDLQDSNYAQARAIVDKVDRLGYRMVPLDMCSAAERVTKIPDREVEYLAYIEHRRWVDERLAAGWKKGPRDAEAKTTPYLVPYDELSDQVKDYDRQPVRDIISILEDIGLALCR